MQVPWNSPVLVNARDNCERVRECDDVLTLQKVLACAARAGGVGGDPSCLAKKGAQTLSCRVLRVTPDTNASTMELHWERLGRLFGPLVIVGSLSGLLHLEFEWSLRWAVVAGLFVAVRLQKWALI